MLTRPNRTKLRVHFDIKLFITPQIVSSPFFRPGLFFASFNLSPSTSLRKYGEELQRFITSDVAFKCPEICAIVTIIVTLIAYLRLFHMNRTMQALCAKQLIHLDTGNYYKWCRHICVIKEIRAGCSVCDMLILWASFGDGCGINFIQ